MAILYSRYREDKTGMRCSCLQGNLSGLISHQLPITVRLSLKADQPCRLALQTPTQAASLRRIAELLHADARLVHQPTLGDGEHGYTFVVFGARGGRGRILHAVARTGGTAGGRGGSRGARGDRYRIIYASWSCLKSRILIGGECK
jgi:hypothetical protein